MHPFLIHIRKVLFAGLLLFQLPGSAQSKRVNALAEQIYTQNNQQNYAKSRELIYAFLGSDTVSNDDRYYAYLYLSMTYKRLFDYENVLTSLDKALEYGTLTINKESYYDNILCQKAFAYFDIQQYSKADQLMAILENKAYSGLNNEEQAKLLMQRGYLCYMKKAYQQADSFYTRSVKKMQAENPCDLPIVYGKIMVLHARMKNLEQVNADYHLAMNIADSCGILKYKLYANEMMFHSYLDMGMYQEAYYYRSLFDSLNEQYARFAHLTKLREVELKYNSAQKERDLLLKDASIRRNNFRIAILTACLIILLLSGITYVFWNRKRKTEEARKNYMHYTRHLIHSIENERKRIATDLHDSIGHKLLLLKRKTPGKDQSIDEILEEVRSVSRNLHPVLFENIGLRISIENLIAQLNDPDGTIFSLDYNYNGELSKPVELQIYRIIQEAVSNIVKYAHAIAAKISIETSGSYVLIKIMDSGIGFDAEKTIRSEKTFGLLSIIQRSETLGGHASIQSEPGKTSIEIKIPY